MGRKGGESRLGGKKGKKKRTEVNYDDGNFIINNNNIN